MKILHEINYYDGPLEFLGEDGENETDDQGFKRVWYCRFIEGTPFYPPDGSQGRLFRCVTLDTEDQPVSKEIYERDLSR